MPVGFSGAPVTRDVLCPNYCRFLSQSAGWPETGTGPPKNNTGASRRACPLLAPGLSNSLSLSFSLSLFLSLSLSLSLLSPCLSLPPQCASLSVATPLRAASASVKANSGLNSPSRRGCRCRGPRHYSREDVMAPAQLDLMASMDFWRRAGYLRKSSRCGASNRSLFGTSRHLQVSSSCPVTGRTPSTEDVAWV